MHRRGVILLLGIGLMVLVTFVAFVWVPPAVAGPTVDCGEIDETTCAELLPQVIAEAKATTGLFAMLMPVTSVSLFGSATCLSYSVWFPFGFGVATSVLC